VSIKADNPSAQSTLEAQRRNRPTSPHLSIYRPQISWICGALHRNTAIVLSGSFYVFGFAYLVSPLLGWHLDSASMAAWFSALPILVKLAIKGVYGFSLAFHTVHGIRHLIWDTGAMLTNKQVQVSGWLTVGVSAAATVVCTLV